MTADGIAWNDDIEGCMVRLYDEHRQPLGDMPITRLGIDRRGIIHYHAELPDPPFNGTAHWVGIGLSGLTPNGPNAKMDPVRFDPEQPLASFHLDGTVIAPVLEILR